MEIEVLNAQLVRRPQRNIWMLAVEVTDDGTSRRVVSVLPEDALEWHTATYGLDDLTDEEIWESLLIDQFTPGDLTPLDVPEAQARSRVTAQRAGRKVGRRPKARRAMHDGRPLKAAGAGMEVLVDSDGDDPIAAMVAHRRRRPEHVEARRELVRQAREAKAERRGRAVDPDALLLAKAEKIRARRGQDTTERQDMTR